MLTRLPPAVYQTAIRPVRRRGGRRRAGSGAADQPPYPMWPAIKELGRWVCMPGLRRAIYGERRGLPPVQPATMLARAQNHLIETETLLSPFARSWALAFLQHFYGSDEDRALAFIAASVARIESSESSEEEDDQVFTAIEAALRACTVGWLPRFWGVRDAFATAHEIAHWVAGHYHSGIQQNREVERAHAMLGQIATVDSISSADAQQLWVEFDRANSHFTKLVARFKKMEEVFATYMAVRLVPPTMRAAVHVDLERALRRDGIQALYQQLVMASEEDPLGYPPLAAALMRFDLTTRLLLRTDKDSLAGLTTVAVSLIPPWWEIDREVLSQLGGEVLASEDIDALLDEQGADWSQALGGGLSLLAGFQRRSMIRLVGSGREVDVRVVTVGESPESDQEEARQQAFFESLRQQISRGCGLGCPYRREGQPCCERNHLLWNVWQRLPIDDQQDFQAPTCPSPA